MAAGPEQGRVPDLKRCVVLRVTAHRAGKPLIEARPSIVAGSGRMVPFGGIHPVPGPGIGHLAESVSSPAVRIKRHGSRRRRCAIKQPRLFQIPYRRRLIGLCSVQAHAFPPAAKTWARSRVTRPDARGRNRERRDRSGRPSPHGFLRRPRRRLDETSILFFCSRVAPAD